jgi:1-acyl-sn-glycerol-3-phosphate acyltransferase
MFYWFSWLVLRLVLFLRCRYVIKGLSNVPRKGGLILLANHRDYTDPEAAGCAIYFRRMHFMAKEELFHHFFFKRLITALGAFPVKRGEMSKELIRTTTELLKSGKMVIIFGEGTRNKDLSIPLLPIKPGFAFLAKLADVPVVPVYLKGTTEILHARKFRPTVSVQFGKPIYDTDIRSLAAKVQAILLDMV